MSKVGITYSLLIVIVTTRGMAMNDKNSWNKQNAANLKYHKKNNRVDEVKQSPNISKV